MTESEDGEGRKEEPRGPKKGKKVGRKKIKSISLLYYHYRYYTLQKTRFKSKSE